MINSKIITLKQCYITALVNKLCLTYFVKIGKNKEIGHERQKEEV